jgi:hypothetical protein
MSKTNPKLDIGTDRIQLRPGYIVVDCSKATGGVQYQQTEHLIEKDGNVGGAEEIATWSTRRIVDHKQVVSDIDALVKRVDYLLRVHCSRAGWGWFADKDAAAKVRHGMDLLQEQADTLNRDARRLGSARRVHLSVVFAAIDVANESIAQEVYRTVLDNLQAIHDALRAGMAGSELDKLMLRAKNMGNVAVGITGTALTDALSRVPEWRAELRAAVKGTKDANGLEPAKAGAKLNLDPLEAAIQLFSPFNLGED